MIGADGEGRPPPPPGADLLAEKIRQGGPRDRLGVAQMLANDILRISAGVADHVSHVIANERGYADLQWAVTGLQERLAMALAVVSLLKEGADKSSGNA